jgi:hypothetical protein
MSDKRPCSECRRWFTKDPRVGKRQHGCPRPECVAKRRKRASADWRRGNPDKVIEARLRRRLPKAPPDPPLAVLADPLLHFSPRVLRDVMDLKMLVFIREFGKVLVGLARTGRPPVRHEMKRKTKVVASECAEVLPAKPVRHEMRDKRQEEGGGCPKVLLLGPSHETAHGPAPP